MMPISISRPPTRDSFRKLIETLLSVPYRAYREQSHKPQPPVEEKAVEHSPLMRTPAAHEEGTS